MCCGNLGYTHIFDKIIKIYQIYIFLIILGVHRDDTSNTRRPDMFQQEAYIPPKGSCTNIPIEE